MLMDFLYDVTISSANQNREVDYLLLLICIFKLFHMLGGFLCDVTISSANQNREVYYRITTRGDQFY